jgi:hypothetical protein
MTLGPVRAAAAIVAALSFGFAGVARAQEETLIDLPGEHLHYLFEMEPQFLFGYGFPFNGPHGDAAFGIRATINIADGFVTSINDSVAVGIGADFDVYGDLLVPVVLQWNFWLSPSWSVFAEPGVALGSGATNEVVPILDLGGRLHLGRHVALTLRAGYPAFSLGFSFLL